MLILIVLMLSSWYTLRVLRCCPMLAMLTDVGGGFVELRSIRGQLGKIRFIMSCVKYNVNENS
ncbi:MAG: hypothetical protein LBQ66_04200 [Planctomycetaceae bacterium]|nr:hypothetical protein [Planctomycetaceae bacterium]